MTDEQTETEIIIMDAPTITAYAAQAKTSINEVLKRWSELHTAARNFQRPPADVSDLQNHLKMEAFAEAQLILSEKIGYALIEINANLALLSLNLAQILGERQEDDETARDFSGGAGPSFHS